ncbi:Crp/Fnr family transcriptional regulator [Listeria ilorinensis]|uniref:Crp/Fnr family transcriptional regulator n=1 Tax=Listeria ilorinensis TaxID=2867439 RepID=UPI001EF53F80|nr:Crp/Fnr family transcriptional regulator [Listeria ilorinensis]
MEYYKNNKVLVSYLQSVALADKNLRRLNLKKESYVLTEFEKANNLYWVESGFLGVEVQMESSPYLSTFIFENDFFGLDAFSSFKRKNHTIKVLSSEASMIEINTEFLLNALNKKPELYSLLLENFTDILQRHYQFFDFILLDPIERVKKTLLYLSGFIGSINAEEQVQLPMEINQKVLASFCRTSQSRISHCLKVLTERGFIVNSRAPFILIDHDGEN